MSGYTTFRENSQCLFVNQHYVCLPFFDPDPEFDPK